MTAWGISPRKSPNQASYAAGSLTRCGDVHADTCRSRFGAGPASLKTPRAAVVAGILFAFLFATTIILIRLKMPEGVGDSAVWLEFQGVGISIASCRRAPLELTWAAIAQH